MKKGVSALLWTLVVISVVLQLVNALFPNTIPLLHCSVAPGSTIGGIIELEGFPDTAHAHSHT